MRFLILTLVVINFYNPATAKEIYLVKGGDIVDFGIKSFIGLTTKTDTIVYNRELGFCVHSYTKDSITIQRPTKYYDSTVICKNDSFPYIPLPFRYRDSYRSKKIRYCRIWVIDEFEYKTYAIKELTSITCGNEGNAPGCMTCILFPPAYLYTTRKIRESQIPKIHDLQEWKLIVRENNEWNDR